MREIKRREKKYWLTCDAEADDQGKDQEAEEDDKADPRAPVDDHLFEGIGSCVLVSVEDDVGEHQEEAEADEAEGSKDPSQRNVGQWWLMDEDTEPGEQEVDCQ